MTGTGILLFGCCGMPVILIGVLLLTKGPGFFFGLYKTFRMIQLGLNTNPSRITLQRAADNDWHQKNKVQSLVRELQRSGFSTVGAWTVEEIPTLALAGMIDEQRRTFAVIYDMAVVGVWMDLCCLHEDGTGLTVTNASIGWGMDQQPDREKIGHKGASIPEMIALLDNHPQLGQRSAIEPGDFVRVFEGEYAREQDWRLARGGPTAEEIERTGVESGTETDPKLIEEVRASMAAQSMPEIRRACIANHLSSEALTAEQRQELDERLVVIHDRMTKEQVLAMFAAMAGEAARELEEHPAYEAMEADWDLLTPREVFSRLTNAIVNPAFPTLRGRVSSPVEADIYLMSESND